MMEFNFEGSVRPDSDAAEKQAADVAKEESADESLGEPVGGVASTDEGEALTPTERASDGEPKKDAEEGSAPAA